MYECSDLWFFSNNKCRDLFSEGAYIIVKSTPRTVDFKKVNMNHNSCSEIWLAKARWDDVNIR